MSKENQVLVHSENRDIVSYFSSISSFESGQRMAKVFVKSDLVPISYRGEEKLGNAMIALDMANRMGVNPLMVMQNLYIVHGSPSWSSKFLIAAVNACGKFSPLRYEYKGTEDTDEWSCRAYALDKKTEERLDGSWVSIGMAKAEGWYTKSGSKWKTMPQLMMQYRSASFFQRTYAPEISMGFPTVEEIEDVGAEKWGKMSSFDQDIDEKKKEKAAKMFGGRFSEEAVSDAVIESESTECINDGIPLK